MAFLEKFSAEEKEMLVSLPYRAGVWIGAIDRSGGAQSKDTELVTLEKIIREKASGMLESAFVHEVMAEICTRKSDWPAWAESVHAVPLDAEKALALISKKMPPRDLDAYRQNIMYIAVEIAKTFREFDAHAPFLTHVADLFRRFLDKFVGVARGGAHEGASWRSISFEEDVALSGLSKALGLSSGEESILEEGEHHE